MAIRVLNVEFDGRRIPLYLGGSDERNSQGNYCTIIIGKNGAGKSRLLAELCKVFAKPSDRGPFTVKRPRPTGNQSQRPFTLEYQVDGQTVGVAYKAHSLDTIELNGERADGQASVPAPRRVISTTITPFDKFPMDQRERIWDERYETDGESPGLIYRYLGGKIRFGQTSVYGRISRVLESLLFSSATDNLKRSRMTEVFNLLGYHPVMLTTFGFRLPIKLLAADTPSDLVNSLDRTRNHYWTEHHIEELRHDHKLQNELFAAVQFALELSSNGRSVSIPIDVTDLESHIRSRYIYSQVMVLRRYGILSFRKLRLAKVDSELTVDISEASSGEQSIALTMLGIASEIEDDSLVVIDEPEISLHPEWQEQFVDLLISTFAGYSGCHFLLATHSPQILARAHAGSCALVTMDDAQIVAASEFSRRSADFQLATQFETPGFRNEYLGREAFTAVEQAARGEVASPEFLDRVQLLENARPHLQDDDPVANLIDALLKVRGELEVHPPAGPDGSA